MFKTHLVNRYNVYKGGKQLIGVAGELTLPEVTNLTDTMEGAGTGGNMDIPVIGLLDDMEMQEILRHVDHTLLSQTATWGKRSRRCATTPSPMGPHRYAFPHLMLSRQRHM